MKTSGMLVSLLATTAVVIAQGDNPSFRSGDPIPNSYILQFADHLTGGVGAITNDAFLGTVQSLLNLDIGININKQHNYDLFKGATFSFDDASKAADGLKKLAAHANIRQIWPNRGYLLRRTESEHSDKDESLSGSLKARREYETRQILIEKNVTYTPHIMTQIDKLHEQGILGDGAKICVLDSGVDYRHPSLGDGFGPGHLIALGRDYVGDNYTVADNNPMPDDDPMDICDGHGTHVLGIIAAQPGNEYGIVGIAPNSTFGMYRTFSCHGATATSILLQATLDAYQDGCQIISMSAGVQQGWSEDPWTYAAQRIVEHGVPCIFSAGNSGGSGPFHANNPGLGDGVTSAASVNSEVIPFYGVQSNFTIDGGEPQSFNWQVGSDRGAWGGVSLPLWAPRLNELDNTDSDDDCSKVFPADTPELSGYVVLVHRKNCDDSDLARPAAAHGAKYMIYYNDFPLYTPNITTDANITGLLAVAGVFDFQGYEWIRAMAAGKKITVHMEDPKKLPFKVNYTPNKATPGLLSFFTSWGLTYELHSYPSFAGVGGYILSTYPINKGSWYQESGTSQAAPMIAGIYALVAQVRKTWDPATLKSVLSATADPQVYYNERQTFPYLAPAHQQGGGTVRAFDAAYATVVLSKPSIAFNDTDHFDPHANFTIKNLGKEAVTYNLGHVGAATAYTFDGENLRPSRLTRVKTTTEYATVDFDSSQVTIPAGGEVMVSFTLTPPAVDPKFLPIYSGYITMNGTNRNSESFSLPYTGVVGSMHSLQLINEARLTTSKAKDNAAVTDWISFSVPKDPSNVLDNVTYPVAYIDLAMGTQLVDAQLIVAVENDQFYKETNLGSINNLPLPEIPANDPLNGDGPIAQKFLGQMADNSMVPEGSYYFRMTALKIFGDMANPQDYEWVKTPVFNITYF